MTKQEFLAKIDFMPEDPAAFRSATQKLARHMRHKFGHVDWAAEFSEAGTANLVYFYEESLTQTKHTFNRGW